MSVRKKRRRWKPEEKLRIVLAGLDGTIEVSELCRREGINPTQYYGWKKHLMDSAGQVFADDRKKKPSTDDRLAADLRRKDAVIAEITAENLDLKKGHSRVLLTRRKKSLIAGETFHKPCARCDGKGRYPYPVDPLYKTCEVCRGVGYNRLH